MLLEYPLQQRARHRSERLQLDFVERAKVMLGTADDCVVRPGGRGLLLVARNEEALETQTSRLRETFGAALEFTRREVRLVGSPPQEPLVHVRVNAPVARIEPVRRLLLERGVAVQDESRGLTRCLLQGEAPLARILGLGIELKEVTLGSALLWTTLVGYAPCMVTPLPREAVGGGGVSRSESFAPQERRACQRAAT
jgi:hypothetical protein